MTQIPNDLGIQPGVLPDSDNRLIEVTLPLQEISTEAEKEKSVRHGHISTLHIWWARRPLVVCRAAILGSVLRDPGNEQGRKTLTNFLTRFCRWDASTDQRLIQEARRLVIESNGSPPRVLDCFAGGGAIPLESLRLGCETFASELNPVAITLLLATVAYPMKFGTSGAIQSTQSSMTGGTGVSVRNLLAHDFEKWANWVLDQARNEIEKFYPSTGNDEVPLAYLWARTLKCPNPACGAQVPLVKHLWLAKHEDSALGLKMQADTKSKRVSFTIVEGKTKKWEPGLGTIRLGSMQCPVCKEGTLDKFEIKAAARKSGFGQQPLAVVCGTNKGGRRYRLFNARDLQGFDEARAKLDSQESNWTGSPSLLPNEPISTDYDWVLKPPMFGLTRWRDIFNSRQNLALTTFVKKIRQAHEEMLRAGYDAEYSKVVTTYLALCLDRLVDYNSTACVWTISGEFVAGTFGRQAIPIAWDYCEVNPFREASGGWKNSVGWIRRVVEHCSALSPNFASVTQSSATRLPYPDAYFDVIVTDPPYYDAVPYADLSDFFYVWLKRTIGDLYGSLFSTPLTPKTEELVEQSDKVTSAQRRRKDKAFYETGMMMAFKEAFRVLKPNGICVVAFAHKSTTAWEKLISAVLGSGFRVTGSWPIRTERKARLRAHGSAALASSVWMICRRRNPNAGIGSWRSVQDELSTRIRERLEYFVQQGIRGADAILSAIGPALEVFGKYERVEKVTGDPVSVSEFLDKVREVVAHHALTTVLSEQELGKIDPETAFYVLWKWTFESGTRSQRSGVADASASKDARPSGNNVLVPFDEALKLARSVGAEIEVLLEPGGLLSQEKEYVNVVGPDDRSKVQGLGEALRDGSSPAVIDMVHRALNLWATGNHGSLDEYLDKSGGRSDETFWRVAQALSNLLPPNSREKQLLDGLLGHHGLSVVGSPDTRRLDEFVGESKA